ncbi:MAG: hypothetical protein N4A45_09835 [Flavobacteriales bacterium]|nr:hypothetical protein [Flavobacteriales bacterium]
MKRIIFTNILFILLYSCSNDRYSLCGLGIKYPYYYTELSYEGELFAISKIFDKQYIPVKNGTNRSGIITVFFDINCHGRTGNFRYKTLNFDYLPIDLNPDIIDQILTITKTLDDWNPGVNEKGNNVNSFMFLTFKIKDGQLINILPK